MSQTYTPTLLPESLMFQGVIARRFCAFLIDIVLMGMVGWLLAISIFIFGIFTFGLGFLMFHIVPFLPLLYFSLFVASGGTPGQRLFGLSVRQDADLSAPTPAQAFVWTILLWLSFFIAGGLPFLMALFGSRHRAGHDIFSGLVIIRGRQISY
jgi:uncharacterized RDD family membrane protein YckC